eukprot:2280277-Amphidinium_carterae.1
MKNWPVTGDDWQANHTGVSAPCEAVREPPGFMPVATLLKGQQMSTSQTSLASCLRKKTMGE